MIGVGSCIVSCRKIFLLLKLHQVSSTSSILLLIIITVFDYSYAIIIILLKQSIIFILVVDATFSLPVSCYHYYSVSWSSLVISFFFIIRIVIVILLYHCYYYPWHQLDSWAIVESESCEFTESIFSLLTRGSTFLLRNLW